jgi:hypothetical protein
VNVRRALVALLLLVACTGSGATSSPSVATADGTPVAPAVSEAVRCPAHVPERLSSKGISGLRRTLVPLGPSRAVICRYPPISADPRRPSVATVNGASLAALVTSLDALRPMPRGLFACPIDDGSMYLLRFDYPDGGRLSVIVHLSGCRFATNGRRNVSITAKVRTTLASLMRSSTG